VALFGVTILGERLSGLKLAGHRPHRRRGDIGRTSGMSGAIASISQRTGCQDCAVTPSAGRVP
jgi:hypothetical protein